MTEVVNSQKGDDRAASSDVGPRRRWRACAFVRFRLATEYPELSPDGRTHSLLASKWTTEAEARDDMWDMRASCESSAWTFWLEPEDLTTEEREVYLAA